MKDLSHVVAMIDRVWEEPLRGKVPHCYIDVSLYNNLKSEIPDNVVVLEEVFPENELDDIWENFKPYLESHKIFPFIGVLGGAVICIGYGENNSGEIFYFDFDFGKIPLDGDDLNSFLKKLKKA